MKYIKELREGENVIEHYLCKSRASMKSRNGKTYLSLKLQDKTGIVDAKVWDMNKDIQSFQENDFIKVDAFVTTFNNELQLNVKRIRRSREGEYDPADFIPSTDKNIDEMYTQLLAYIKTIQSPYIKKLLEEIFLSSARILNIIPRQKPCTTASAAVWWSIRFPSRRSAILWHRAMNLWIEIFSLPAPCCMMSGRLWSFPISPKTIIPTRGSFWGISSSGRSRGENRGLSAKACHASDALHPFPPRRAGIWFSQGARNHRGLYFALRRQHGRKNEDV